MVAEQMSHHTQRIYLGTRTSHALQVRRGKRMCAQLHVLSVGQRPGQRTRSDLESAISWNHSIVCDRNGLPHHMYPEYTHSTRGSTQNRSHQSQFSCTLGPENLFAFRIEIRHRDHQLNAKLKDDVSQNSMGWRT